MKIILSLLAALPMVCLSQEIEYIHVFYADSAPYIDDLHSGKYVHVELHDLSLVGKTNTELNRLVRERIDVDAVDQNNVREKYSAAFSELQNSPSWRDLYLGFEEGSASIESAMSFGVEKVPAVIINEKYIVYGISSIQSAVALFQEWSEI